LINHRGPEFSQLLKKATAQLKEMFKTEGDVLILTGSGTGSMEAAVVNTLSPGDRVLAVTNGVFGERFADIAKTFGADVQRLDFEYGSPVDPEAVRRALAADASIKAVLVTHNETSTATTNDVQAVGQIVRAADRLYMVDAMSSIGAIPLPVDEWLCDVVVTCSQKSWMIPPGLSFASMNQRAWAAFEQAKMPRYYWDLGRAKRMAERGQTPWTPAVASFFALSVALDLMQNEGLDNIFARHARIGAKAREGVESLGLKLVAEGPHASNTVTGVWSPEGIAEGDIRKVMREEYGVVVTGGQGKLEGKIFRIGHLGYVSESDIDIVLDALQKALSKVGYTPVRV